MSDSKGAFSVQDRPHARTQTRTRHGNASLAHPAPPEEPPGGRDRGHTHTIPLTALPRVSRGGAKGAPQGTTYQYKCKGQATPAPPHRRPSRARRHECPIARSDAPRETERAHTLN